MTDCEIILEILADNKFHHVLEIMERGKPGAKNWAVRSRIANLKKKGFDIESIKNPDRMASYRLKQKAEIEYKLDQKGQTYFV
jgi:hypothetical protein